ncbi:MAG TPA: carboxypeptidase-like regulatory domain-containing protein, partial [Kofleriaceae bacterium]|nr:carboxypeptidase-like regulatory domain-containing protein [Kofleriaceae bacterium]
MVQRIAVLAGALALAVVVWWGLRRAGAPDLPAASAAAEPERRPAEDPATPPPPPPVHPQPDPVSTFRLSGKVVDAAGAPVAGATVYAGRMLFGSGSSAKSQGGFGRMTQSNREATTDEAGAFSLAGFSQGDLSVVAEHPTLGRSKTLRVSTGD